MLILIPCFAIPTLTSISQGSHTYTFIGFTLLEHQKQTISYYLQYDCSSDLLSNKQRAVAPAQSGSKQSVSQGLQLGGERERGMKLCRTYVSLAFLSSTQNCRQPSTFHTHTHTQTHTCIHTSVQVCMQNLHTLNPEQKGTHTWV